jgi:GNAT superfamily N-acetyltransferase
MLRALELKDMDRVAVVQRRSREHALPWIAVLHTPEEDQWFFRKRVFSSCHTSGYFENEELVGFIAFREDWIDHLYVLPNFHQRGIGTALLKVAMSQYHALSLWTFQRNAVARRFYEKHGFVLADQTDGAGNEEGEPDALYVWKSPAQT